MRSDEKVITWVTPVFFLDTDIHVIQHLAGLYKIEWYIIYSASYQTDYEEEIKEIRNKGVHIERFQIHKRGMDPRNLMRFINLAKAIRNRGSRFVYVYVAYPFYFLPVMAHFVGTEKTVLGIHNVHVPNGGSYYFRNKIYNNYAIRTFKHFQVFSKSQYDYLKEKSGRKDVRCIPFFLKDYGKPIHPKRKEECVTFLNFGYIRDYKRIDVLISAAQEAYKKTGTQFKVIIAGACLDWNKYQKMIETDELFDLRIRHINNKEIPDLFAEADYFVLPYQDIAQSGAAIVALNYEVPIIASRLPAFEEYIVDQKTGYLINPADVLDLQEKIEYIIANHDQIYPELKENLRRNNQKCFDAEKIVYAYRELINDFIE